MSMTSKLSQGWHNNSENNTLKSNNEKTEGYFKRSFSLPLSFSKRKRLAPVKIKGRFVVHL